MFLKYLLPFDRLVINSPYRIDEARERLERVTVNRYLFHFWDAVPGNFEGSIDRDRFSILTSAEGHTFFGWEHSRNTFRPVCDGHMSPSPGGCRIDVKMRPLLFVLLLPLVWFFFFSSMMTQPNILMSDLSNIQLFAYLIALVCGSNYVLILAFVWYMRNRAKEALLSTLT